VSGYPGGAAPVYASVGRRFGGWFIDTAAGALVLLASGLIPALLTGARAWIELASPGLAVLGIVQWWLLGVRGYTIGKYISETRVVDAKTGAPIGILRVLPRSLVLGVSASLLIPLVVLVIVVRHDRRGQGWHDKLVRSVEIMAGAVAAPDASGAGATGVTPPGSAWDQLNTMRIPAPPPGARRWVLRSQEGGMLAVAGPTLIGRDPDELPGLARWPVEESAVTVSMTHARVTMSEGALWIEDLDSTNGVVIRRNGDEIVLDRRDPVKLVAGDVFLLGEYKISVTLVVG
jgi:hypothetical protein